MDYISVKEAAKKFNISERRVQKLCETKRIEGSTMVSGVWLVPSDAEKPIDNRLSNVSEFDNYFSLKELCDKLSISLATGKNWIKLGKLKPKHISNNTPYFSIKYVNNIYKELENGDVNALRNRRNKKYVSGNSLYNSYVSSNCINLPIVQNLLSLISENNIILNDNNIQYLIADCALHLVASKNKIDLCNCEQLLQKYINNQFNIKKYDVLINDLIDNQENALSFCNKYPFLFKNYYIYESNEDVLGLLYISCKNIGSRKITGSYYTPTNVVKKLISKLDIKQSEKILDPCCGTGNFLLQLPDSVDFENIYANDLDNISVKITRLNMALKYNVEISSIYKHITELNYLTNYNNGDFEYIIGNPPWGYSFSKEEKNELKTLYKATSGANIESFDVFIEKSLNNLSINGHLSYVLPESVLNVKAHKEIREIILETCSIKNLDYLGNAFDRVQCPCIILDLQRTGKTLSTIGLNVDTGKEKFTIETKRDTTPDYFSFLTNDDEYEILTKIKNVKNSTTLFNRADFALGIVTGNNGEYISNTKTEYNEMILKGSDIKKYTFSETNNFITFKPESFQQVAPTRMYRAKEKLLYRFISNQLVFAYDNKQTLSLNSCNIVIPNIDGIDIKYVLAILNSRVAQFLFKKEFNSVKVLRSHIESIPIPLVNETTQKEIISIVDCFIKGAPKKIAGKLYDDLDLLVCKLYKLNNKEIKILINSVDCDNKFIY